MKKKAHGILTANIINSHPLIIGFHLGLTTGITDLNTYMIHKHSF